MQAKTSSENIIRTATGKEFPCGSFTVGGSPSKAHIRILNTPLITVATVFGDPRETVQLWHNQEYLAMHTVLSAIVPEAGAIRVVLTKE